MTKLQLFLFRYSHCVSFFYLLIFEKKKILFITLINKSALKYDTHRNRRVGSCLQYFAQLIQRFSFDTALTKQLFLPNVNRLEYF